MIINLTYTVNGYNTIVNTNGNSTVINATNDVNECNAVITQTINKTFVVVSNMGTPGLSAYQLAVLNGFVGTEVEWLASLKQYNYIARHGYTNGVSYCGIAKEGTLETDQLWKITRITVATNGTTVTAIAENVDWTNYLTHTYL